MNHEQYAQLVCDTGQALNLPDSDVLPAGQGFIIDGIEIRLLFNEVESGSCILCVTEVGLIADAVRAQVHESLLMLNFLSGSKTTGTYALDPLTQRASFVVVLSRPARLTPTDLASLLKLYARRSLHLQGTLLKDGTLRLPLDTATPSELFPNLA